MKFLVLIAAITWGIAAFAQQPAAPEKPKTETSEEVQKPAPSSDVKTEEESK